MATPSDPAGSTPRPGPPPRPAGDPAGAARPAGLGAPARPSCPNCGALADAVVDQSDGSKLCACDRCSTSWWIRPEAVAS